MSTRPRFDSPSAVGRTFFGGATIVTALMGVAGDKRWLAASGAFGIAWWGWDFVWENVLGPLGGLVTGILGGSVAVEEPPDLTLDDTVRLLESHLASDGVPRHVQIQSALRLAEIYRLGRNDPAKADAVLQRVRERWPDAPELKPR